MNRDDVVMMARVKNEARWISRCLASAWVVAKTAVVWDDGSTDGTIPACVVAVGGEGPADIVATPSGLIGTSKDGTRVLHIIKSMFQGTARASERVHEIRDKEALWRYCAAEVPFRHVLCLDGDEALSQKAIRRFPEVIEALEKPDGPHMFQMPFIYLWDGEDKQRVDGIYGNWLPPQGDGFKRIRHPRLFTVHTVDNQTLFNMHFRWRGGNAGFHCGSIPTEGYFPGGVRPRMDFADLPVLHFGYLDDAMRRRKFEWYNALDPDNEAEGGYRHIIGESNHHAPGPVVLASFEDV